MPHAHSGLRAVLLACALFCVAMPQGTASAATPIQPGDPLFDITAQKEQCSIGFIFIGSGAKMYASTAGHCVIKIGDRMGPGGQVPPEVQPYTESWGTAVWKVESGSDDIALIAIDNSQTSRVRASVPDGEGPKGYTTPAQTETGQTLKIRGNGTVIGMALPGRVGVLIDSDHKSYRAETMAVGGDSGGPILDGQLALGIIAQGYVPGISGSLTEPPFVFTDEGPTVERMLALFKAAGYNLTLATA